MKKNSNGWRPKSGPVRSISSNGVLTPHSTVVKCLPYTFHKVHAETKDMLFLTFAEGI